MATKTSDNSSNEVQVGKRNRTKKSTKAVASNSVDTTDRAEIATTISNSDKRCLSAASLADSRLEILSLLDFKPLYSAGNDTLAGQLFDLRVTERAADLESVKQLLENASSSEAYTKAINSYNSALVASEAEFALLKMLILLQKYATHTSRFLPFIGEYELPADLDVSFLGNSTIDKLAAACSVSFSDVADNATQILMQVLASTNCAAYGISPYRLAVDVEDLDSGKFLSRVVAKNTGTPLALYNLAFLSRDLTFSNEMYRIKENLEPDEEYKTLIETALGSNFASSAREINDDVMSEFIGSNVYSNLRKQIDQQNDVRMTSVKTGLGKGSGVLGAALYDSQNLLPESFDKTYNSSNYTTLEPLVDEAFSGTNILDFSKYSDAVDALVDSSRNLALFGKTSFRLLDKIEETNGSAVSAPIAENEQPLSMASITTVLYDVFNRRFASGLKKALFTKYYNWQTPEHVNHTKALAWLLIRDNPDLAKKIVSAVFDDYEDGFLTAAAVPEPIEGTAEVDEDGEEIAGTEQMSEVVYLKGGTETTANLTGKSSRLLSRIRQVGEYYRDDVSNASTADGDTRILSSNPGEGLSEPVVRTNYDRTTADMYEYFGSPNPNRDDPDLRLINVMTSYVERIEDGTVYSEKNYYYSSKIVAAEIADSVLEVLRLLVSSFVEVEAIEDGDPTFPFLEDMKGPYGGTSTSTWGYAGPGYDSFGFSLWVNTIEQFKELFFRSTDEVTYFRRVGTKKLCDKIIDLFGAMMTQYAFLSVRKEENPGGIEVELASRDTEKVKVMYPVTACIKFEEGVLRPSSWRADGDDAVGEHCNALSTILQDLLTSSFESYEEDVESIGSQLPPPLENRYALPVEEPGVAVGGGIPEPDPLRGAGETITSAEPPARPALFAYSELLKLARREDLILSFMFDFIDQYANRVDNYKTATLDLIHGEDGALGELVRNLKSTDAGTDVLQNMSVNQLALKEIALREEQADPDNGYLPKLSILTDTEIEAVKALCNENVLRSPEGDTTRVVVVGIPIGLFGRFNIGSEFCLRVSYRDIEYPQIVFRSKSYKFDKDLYVLPDDIEAASRTNNFSDIIETMEFSKIRVEVKESTDTSASVELIDDVETLSYDSGNKTIYMNLATSELLKMYYRIMLGLNFSEIAFQSTPEGLNIPISSATGGLASSMASQISAISSFSAGLAGNISDLVSDLSTLDNPDDFISGELEPADEALLADLRNAYQSRLLSPEILRSRAISAKMFDRVYALPVDPDEFYIVAPGEAQVGDVETPQEILDFYLNKEIIEETGLEAPYAYKLAPRRSAEGSMAFGSVTVTLTSVDDESTPSDNSEGISWDF